MILIDMSPIIPICELHYMRDYFCSLATGRTTPKKNNLFLRWPSWGNHGDSQGWLSRPFRDGCGGAAVLHFQSDWAPTGGFPVITWCCLEENLCYVAV